MKNIEKLCIAKYAKGRCWTGYEPVPGKEPYSDDSCRPVGSKKKKSDKEKKSDKKKESEYEEKSASERPSDKKKDSKSPESKRRLGTVSKPKEQPATVKEPTGSQNSLYKLKQPKAQHMLPYVLGGNFKKDVTNSGKGVISDFTGMDRNLIEKIQNLGEIGLKQRADFKLGPWNVAAGRTGNFDRGGLELSRSF